MGPRVSTKPEDVCESLLWTTKVMEGSYYSYGKLVNGGRKNTPEADLSL